MRSVRGDLLRWAPIAWTERVVRGLALLRWAVVGLSAAAISVLMVVFMGLLLASAGGATLASVVMLVLVSVFILTGGFGLVALVVGCWFVTSTRGTWHLVGARDGALVRTCGTLVPVALLFSYGSLNPLRASTPWMLVERAAVQGVCFCFLLALYRMLRGLSVRTVMPESERKRQIRSARSTVILSGILFLLVGWVPPVSMSAGVMVPIFAGAGSNASILTLVAFASMSGLIRRVAADARLELALAREFGGGPGASTSTLPDAP